MSLQKLITQAASGLLNRLATDPAFQKQAADRVRGLYDFYQVSTGRVNRHTEEEAIERALRTSVRESKEEQTRVAAFVSALYAQHEIVRAAQVGGSLLKRFGVSWFPSIEEKEKRYALAVDEDLEDLFYTRILEEVDDETR